LIALIHFSKFVYKKREIMEKPNREEIIYSLCIEDMQTVAEQEIERELTIEEIHQSRILSL